VTARLDSADHSGRYREIENTPFGLLADPKLWALIIANFLSMTIYSLWTNWASQIFSACASSGSAADGEIYLDHSDLRLFGSDVGRRKCRGRSFAAGLTPIASRKRVCLIAACFFAWNNGYSVVAESRIIATAGMSLSYFWICAWSANHYTLPIDIYGAQPEPHLVVSSLIFAYGFMQFCGLQPPQQDHRTLWFSASLAWFVAFLPPDKLRTSTFFNQR